MESQIIKKSNIDYIGVLDYLIDNSEQPYSNPEAPGISEEEKNRLLDLKQKGQNAVNEMKKMAAAFADEYGLDKCLPMAWLDGSNTKTRKYLWAQLKYSAYADNPISVSIFVEKYGDKSTRYRVSLEIKNDGTDKKTMAKYHSFLDLPLDKAAGLQYIAGSNEWGHPDPLSDPQEVVKQKVESGALRKVQLSKYIERTADSTNALPVDNQVVFGQIMGRFLEKGESKEINLYLNGKSYKAKIVNVNFDKKFNRKKDTMRVDAEEEKKMMKFVWDHQ